MRRARPARLPRDSLFPIWQAQEKEILIEMGPKKGSKKGDDGDALTRIAIVGAEKYVLLPLRSAVGMSELGMRMRKFGRPGVVRGGKRRL